MVPLRRTRILVLTTLAALVAGASSPAGWAARSHQFSATYTGVGSGDMSGTSVSGSATLPGRGNPIGRGTLTGSGRGTFTSLVCVVFSGTATLKGRSGTVRLSASNARACADDSDPNHVTFSGRARVTGGTATFAGAHGTLPFKGSYDQTTKAVKISFSGRITY